VESDERKENSAPSQSAAWPIVLAALVAIGVAGWAASAIDWKEWPGRVAWDPRAWRALLINFMFFTPMALGMAVWPAAVMISRGRWAMGIERHGLAGVAFVPVAIAAFIALVLGREQWATWLAAPYPANAPWLEAGLLFGRDGAGLTILCVLVGLFVWRMRRGRPKMLAAWLVFVFCAVFSMLAFDMVMALDPRWYSALFGFYFFVSCMYIGVAGWTLASLVQRPGADAEQRHDLGKLIVALSLLTTYTMYSQLIVIWYENLPAEVRFAIPRLTLPPGMWVSAALLGVIYLGPLVLLLPVRAKRSRWWLGTVAAAVLAGMWLERWWLITPQFERVAVPGLPELAITVAFAAAMILALCLFRRWGPATFSEE
jgi:hypothetical protein